MKKIYIFALIWLIFAQTAAAGEKAVKLYIPFCTCPLAGAVIVGILEDVHGVSHARVNVMDSAATVFFDNATTTVTALKKALGKANT